MREFSVYVGDKFCKNNLESSDPPSRDSKCYIYQSQNKADRTVNETCTVPTVGKYVTIYKNDYKNMYLVEVEIYGRPLSGKSVSLSIFLSSPSKLTYKVTFQITPYCQEIMFIKMVESHLY